MDWFSVIVGFTLGLLAAVYWSRSRKDLANRAEEKRLEAEGHYLDELRRQLALWLIRENPSAFWEAYRTARGYDAEMRKADARRVAADRASLSAKYPLFSDLDPVGLKHFVPLRSGTMAEFDVVQRYLDISKFLTLLSIEHPLNSFKPFSEQDEEVIERVIQENQDTDLRREIETAMGRYYAFCQNREEADFSDRDYEVFRADEPSQPDIRYGVVVKADGRRGIYWFFVGDEKTYKGYAEADERFKKGRALGG